MNNAKSGFTYNYPNNKYFLKSAKDVIEDLKEKELLLIPEYDIIQNNWLDGYLNACEDCLYACNLSAIALQQHIEKWYDVVPLNQEEHGYADGIHDICEKISEMMRESE